jgi:peroxiredoxin
MIIVSCQPAVKPLQEGLWRGVFTIPGNEIPFQFEVKGNPSTGTSINLINGSDRFEIKNVTYRADSVFIPLELYDEVLKAKISDNALSGSLVKLGGVKPVTGVPFTAEYGKQSRFPASTEKPLVSLQGTWDLEMGIGASIEKTVGNFEQGEAMVTGSILTATGDYRFLDGAVTGRKFALSAFGGSTPYLFKGELDSDSTLTGEFITPRGTTPLKGHRNAKAALPDAYQVTHLKEGFKTIEFSFPNLEGKQVSLAEEKYKGKVVIVTILGSWCPNCLDENAYLAGWYKQNKQRGVEIIGLGFERKNDFAYAQKSLTNLKTRLDIQYEILFAGQSGAANASKALPALNGIASFPTTIFIDKKGNVRKVHSGFNGPATGKFYEEFKAEFNKLVDQLLAEK